MKVENVADLKVLLHTARGGMLTAAARVLGITRLLPEAVKIRGTFVAQFLHMPIEEQTQLVEVPACQNATASHPGQL